uniref:Nanos homolog 1 n=1 Tax=Diabrotica virgifera virgifera TaxID=50390 RepID=A0A6P7GME9_DIAVI
MDSSTRYTFEDLFRFDLGIRIQDPKEDIFEANQSIDSFYQESKDTQTLDNSFARYKDNSTAYTRELGAVAKGSQPSASTSLNIPDKDDIKKDFENFNLVENNHGNMFCGFCRKNNEPDYVFYSHYMKGKDDSVLCPILQKYVCAICGATGKVAHTRRYCPFNQNQGKRGRTTRKLASGREVSFFNHK